jgi:hypothetical protein
MINLPILYSLLLAFASVIEALWEQSNFILAGTDKQRYWLHSLNVLQLPCFDIAAC